MSSSIEFVNYVMDQIRESGEMRARKMFGEYMIYVNEKPIVLVCDNTAFVKILPETQAVLKETGLPYEGAKPHFILNIDDSRQSTEVVSILEKITPLPKPKKKKAKSDLRSEKEK